MTLTAFDIAQRYVGLVREVAGPGRDHPFIQWCLSLCFDGQLDLPDETPWCSAFAQHPAWELRLPRSKSARARSWLLVGTPVPLAEAQRGNDVVVFNRGGNPDPAVIQGPGHVAYFAALEDDSVIVAGGGSLSNSIKSVNSPFR